MGRAGVSTQIGYHKRNNGDFMNDSGRRGLQVTNSQISNFWIGQREKSRIIQCQMTPNTPNIQYLATHKNVVYDMCGQIEL